MDEKVATIHVGISASSINDKIDQLLKYSALVSLLSLSLAAVLLLFALRHWVTKPLSSLFEAIQHLGRDERGGYSKINVSAGDEIGLVSSAFNGLIDDLNASLQTISLHTEKLETLVEERTAELKSVNGQLKDDIAERKRIEGVLHDSESKYRSLSQELHTLLDTIPDAIGLYAPDMKIIWANRSAANLPRSETAPLTGKICYEVFHGRSEPCEVCAVRHSFRTGEPSSELIQRPGGRLLETRAVPLKDPEGRIVSVMEIGRDVTEQRRLEARLRQAQKLEVIGTIAGGIAHDFNNILAAVIGYAELAQLDLPRDGRVSQYLDEVLKSSCRARDLVKQILSFSRQGSEAERMRADLGNVLEETIGMMRASLPATVEIRHDIRCEQPVILADSPQIRQVLVNLCTNAAHAMKEKGGVLEIRLEAVLLGSEETARHADIKAGEYVRLTVSDTGCGMDRATMEKIFDPYFTTKEVGEGSGLGLAVVQGIVKRHGGAITVGSEPGKGSIFSGLSAED